VQREACRARTAHSSVAAHESIPAPVSAPVELSTSGPALSEVRSKANALGPSSSSEQATSRSAAKNSTVQAEVDGKTDETSSDSFMRAVAAPALLNIVSTRRIPSCSVGQAAISSETAATSATTMGCFTPLEQRPLLDV
jgi:hypothetical protein